MSTTIIERNINPHSPPANHPLRSILVVEDQPLFMNGLMALLGNALEPMRIVGVHTLAQMHQSITEEPTGFDYVFLDLHLPDAKDTQALMMALEMMPDVPVVVLTGYATNSLRRRCLGLGANGVLDKCMDPGQLGRRITALINSAEQEKQGETCLLSERQLGVLRELVTGATNLQIAHRLGIQENTVKHHVTQVKRVLQANTRAELVARYVGNL